MSQRILALVDAFNLETRQTQAGEERRFIEARMDAARSELRAAEDQLRTFLQRNRDFRNSPELMLANERLQREVAWRQQVFTSLAQAYEQARIEEVRNIPVTTLIEPPAAPVRPDGRGTAKWGLLALVIGLFSAVLLAFAIEFARRDGRGEDEESLEFGRLRAETLRDLRRPWRLLWRSGSAARR
jgi:uncharacterized protein involved in exopolysaccharide biosynthesis